jgi:outer membrane protein
MKKIIFFVSALLLFTFNTHGAELKIGYVDLNKALNESEPGKKAIKTLEEMVKTKQALINKKGNEIKKLDEEIAKQASILTPESMKKKQQEREKLVRDYNRMVRDSQEEVQKKQAEFMHEILRELRKIVKKIGEEEGYTVIFEIAEGSILYIPEELDLTEKVIKRFNETTKTQK